MFSVASMHMELLTEFYYVAVWLTIYMESLAGFHTQDFQTPVHQYQWRIDWEPRRSFLALRPTSLNKSSSHR